MRSDQELRQTFSVSADDGMINLTYFKRPEGTVAKCTIGPKTRRVIEQ